MGAACTALCGAAVIIAGCIVSADDWVDRNARLVSVAGIFIGLGAVLHALGVW